MAETFTANGTHIFQLDARAPKESVAVSRIVNDLGDGYEDAVLFGSNTGVRGFSLDFPVLKTNAKTCTLDGVDMSPSDYLWNLYLRQQTEGKYFAILSPRNGQYYLCKFADDKLTQDALFRYLWSGSAMFTQVRQPGAYVFDVSKVPQVYRWHTTPIAGATDNTLPPSSQWPDSKLVDALSVSSGVTYQTNEQNGLAIVRLDTTGGNDTMGTNVGSESFYEAFIVMKYRAATFNNFNGIVANNNATTGSPALIGGGSGTNKFFDLGLGSGYQYRKNGVLYAASNQLAPMNTFGIVHIRNTSGWTMADGIAFGVDRSSTFPLRASNVDFGEIIFCSALLPRATANEITEYLGVKWGINV